MKKTSTILVLSLMLLSTIFTSCEAVKNTNNTQRGAAIGAIGGAVIGGILGNNLGKGGNGAMGAVLGGVIGGVAGGVIGNKMDKQAREIETALPGAQVERVGEGIKNSIIKTGDILIVNRKKDPVDGDICLGVNSEDFVVYRYGKVTPEDHWGVVVLIIPESHG
mgnify:CR=1 FL=1